MPKLNVFNSISLDGYFSGPDGDLSWAHEGADDAEWNEFVSGNAGRGGALIAPHTLELASSRAFRNGRVVLNYER